jgi:hypothetical protein
MAGAEHPLAEWYDMMREGFALAPISDPEVTLQDGEALYLRGQPVGTIVPRQHPVFQPAIAKLPPPPRPAKGPPLPMVDLGKASLYLTNRRLIARIHVLSHVLSEVEGEAEGNDPRATARDCPYGWFSLPLSTVRGITLGLDRFLVIRHEQRLLEFFEFTEESPLKWQAYLDLALRPIAEAGGFRLYMAYD